MTELELQQYMLREYPQENARCELWLKNLKDAFCGDEKDDVISYVSAIANMEEVAVRLYGNAINERYLYYE